MQVTELNEDLLFSLSLFFFHHPLFFLAQIQVQMTPGLHGSCAAGMPRVSLATTLVLLLPF